MPKLVPSHRRRGPWSGHVRKLTNRLRRSDLLWAEVPQRKNLIDLGHDLGNLDQDLMHPDQDSRFLAMMSKILPKKILNNFKIGLKIIHSDSKLRVCVKTDNIFFTKIKRHTQKE